jgi:hypothetical protein
MNWLKKIFFKTRKRNQNFRNEIITSLDTFVDEEFISYLYFSNEQIKIDYIESIKKILETTIENGEIQRIKFSNYIVDNKIEIPFILETIKFDDFNGKYKLSKYYTALNVAKHNIAAKINNKIYNFEFEEEITCKHFKSDLRNYTRIETLFAFGDAFFKAKKIKKMTIYFDIIYNDNYDLSDITISNFYRRIGDIYLAIHDRKVALKWYKSGLRLNSKLGVKKIIANLEMEN